MGTGGFSPSHLFTLDITFLFSYENGAMLHPLRGTEKMLLLHGYNRNRKRENYLSDV